MAHPSLNVVGDRCWRCLGATVALFSTVECVKRCHEDPGLYTPKMSPGLELDRMMRAIHTPRIWIPWPLPGLTPPKPHP